MIIFFFKDPIYSYGSILSVPFLLLGIFIFTIYIIYPLELVYPGWITKKRLVKIYLPVALLILIYIATLLLGVEYTEYRTLTEMYKDIWTFQVIFRMVLVLLIFLPAVWIYYIPYTCQNNSFDRKWMRRYIMAITTNMVTYLVVNIYDTFFICSVYIAVSVSYSLYFTYQELFARIIRQPTRLDQHSSLENKITAIESTPTSEPSSCVNYKKKSKETELFSRLEQYMNSKRAWEDPDLSAEKVILELYTNRTSLLKAIHQNGYSGYPAYVNSKRVEEFIKIINNQKTFNYQQTFFDVGFRSKTTALRNFRDITGMIPSEYFQKQTQNNNTY